MFWHLSCGEIRNFSTIVKIFQLSTSFMWRNLKFRYIFQISPHLPCIEIWNFSTWQIFLHMSHIWTMWQISGMLIHTQRSDRKRPLLAPRCYIRLWHGINPCSIIAFAFLLPTKLSLQKMKSSWKCRLLHAQHCLHSQLVLFLLHSTLKLI